MKIYSLLFILMISFLGAQDLSFKEDVKTFQNNLNTEYLTQETTPLRGANFTKFKKHPFFRIDENYKVEAKLVKTKELVKINFPTSSGNIQVYTEYGKIYFKLNHLDHVLTLYTNDRLSSVDGYHDHLFLPFRDYTNGKDTYGGGKYIDLKIPNSDTIIVDFNKSYQPYCAYNATDYNCPIVPETNYLKTSIKAGVKYDDVYFN